MDESLILTEFGCSNPPEKLLEIIRKFESGHYLFTFRGYEVYSPGLYYVFTKKKVFVKSHEDENPYEIETAPFFYSYIEGFQCGIKEFREKWSESVYLKGYVKDLYNLYWISAKGKTGGLKAGSGFITTSHISHEEAKEWGFFSGQRKCLEEILQERPSVLDQFQELKKEYQSSKAINNSEPHFKDYFKSKEKYILIISILKSERFISEGEQGLSWDRDKKPFLILLKSLIDANLIKNPSNNKSQLSRAIKNTFSNLTISAAYIGRTLPSIIDDPILCLSYEERVLFQFLSRENKFK